MIGLAIDLELPLRRKFLLDDRLAALFRPGDRRSLLCRHSKPLHITLTFAVQDALPLSQEHRHQRLLLLNGHPLIGT